MADADALDAVLEDNAVARAALLQAVDALPAERRLERALGEWSVKDVVAHLATWQDGFAAALELVAQGERPVIPGYANDDDAFNAARVAEARELSWEQVLGRLRAARERHDAAVRGLRVLDPDRYAEGRTPRRLASSANHDREHAPQIEVWRRAQGL
ncbi:MAG: DinB family protein [Dehalococcoidia bacterium]|nr:DinB family protein [Dehalococcoidia bacterium]